ncbi:ATP-dependent Clp protease proteolytic subunit-protein 4, chloroplastic [Ancistrocladus abbreviatus]
MQPIARFQGQATDVHVARKEVKNVKAELVKLYSRHIGKSPKQIEADIRRPKYFSPSEAVEYGIVNKVFLIKGFDTLQPVFFRFLELYFVLTFYGCSTLKEAQKIEELFLS